MGIAGCELSPGPIPQNIAQQDACQDKEKCVEEIKRMKPCSMPSVVKKSSPSMIIATQRMQHPR